MTTIGLLSDTHSLLRPQAIEALQGVDLIIHAGDIGSLDAAVVHAAPSTLSPMAVRSTKAATAPSRKKSRQ